MLRARLEGSDVYVPILIGLIGLTPSWDWPERIERAALCCGDAAMFPFAPTEEACENAGSSNDPPEDRRRLNRWMFLTDWVTGRLGL